MFYVYIIKSKNYNQHYTGITQDLRKRFQDHNQGKSPHTSKYRPYSISWYCCFSDKNKAYKFEKYLKSSSGIAFLNKHLL
ncbi:MAG: GIY-YIG nuclease family protein [Candidatus Staskawiczbacteria bacterium]|jgi:predicted GIY-YIG superfamily endonuclease